MEEKFSLKDHLFNEDKVRYLGDLFAAKNKNFKTDRFVSEVMSRLHSLELKERIKWIADVLWRQLGADYEAVVANILKSLPPPLDPSLYDDDFGDFIFAPLGEIVAVHGCSEKYLELSLRVLEELTMRFSMEDSIRYFFRAFREETLLRCKIWATSSNYHVRRLVSEGTRPMLPWSGRIPVTYEQTLPLLSVLHTDKTRYVTRSVANHLNDIAKQNPEVVLETLKSWRKLGKQDTRELDWMTKHALRTLIKQGNSKALALLGYTNSNVTVERFSCLNKKIAPGESLALELVISVPEATDILIDYIIHFVKKNGTTAPKVFKWKSVSLKAANKIEVTKRHTLKADATTFTLYSGGHKVEVQINGSVLASTEFTLNTD